MKKLTLLITLVYLPILGLTQTIKEKRLSINTQRLSSHSYRASIGGALKHKTNISIGYQSNKVKDKGSTLIHNYQLGVIAFNETKTYTQCQFCANPPQFDSVISNRKYFNFSLGLALKNIITKGNKFSIYSLSGIEAMGYLYEQRKTKSYNNEVMLRNETYGEIEAYALFAGIKLGVGYEHRINNALAIYFEPTYSATLGINNAGNFNFFNLSLGIKWNKLKPN